MKKFDAIAAFAFGAPADIAPNRAIARRAESLGHQMGLTIFAQFDVAEDITNHKNLVFLDECEERGVSTFWLAEKLRDDFFLYLPWVELAPSAPPPRLLVVAAPPHIERCVRDLRHVGFGAESDTGLADTYPSAFWFCPESAQWRTRSQRFWWPREYILRWLPWRLYKWVST